MLTDAEFDAGREDNGDARRCTLGLSGSRYADNHDHVGRKFDDLGRGRIERLLFVGEAVLDRYILAIDVAQIAKALIEGVDEVLGPGRRKIGD